MKKLMLVVVSVFLLLFVGSAQAALIGVQLSLPDILSNSAGTYSYNAATDLFSALATPVTITFDGVTLIPITGPTSYAVSFLVDASGNFAGGVGGDDLVITGNIDVDGDSVNDYTGDLIKGEVTNFGWQDLPPTTLDAFDFTFDATGGALAGFYNPALGGGDILTSEISTFSGVFTSNFGGTKAKHNTAPVIPEPASMALLGMGILGLFGLTRRKA